LHPPSERLQGARGVRNELPGAIVATSTLRQKSTLIVSRRLESPEVTECVPLSDLSFGNLGHFFFEQFRGSELLTRSIPVLLMLAAEAN